jgi:ribosomal protein S18 acetylase RimI-like enzyme
MGASTDEPCRLLTWDSAHFGFRIGRLHGHSLTPGRAAAADLWCAQRDVSCLYALTSGDDPLATQVAAENGFVSVDTRVTLERPAFGHPPVSDESAPFSIHEARANDLGRLKALARISHRATRFYFDQNFPRERCDELYERWIVNCFEEPRQTVLIAGSGSDLRGYLSFGITSGRGEISLVAVAEEFRGRRVGGELLAAVLRLIEADGAAATRVVTQARNTPAMRLYKEAGFLVRNVENWFHKWYGQ